MEFFIFYSKLYNIATLKMFFRLHRSMPAADRIFPASDVIRIDHPEAAAISQPIRIRKIRDTQDISVKISPTAVS